ncbi:MAG: class I SAM-dependent methyltransferase [Myxococcaceae bacterium]|nr:class I SAM-dependent methyltransferase [Myxococcaceae bacterium]
MAEQMPKGRLLDVGCGHGVLTALLAYQREDRQVVALDPDTRKTGWARASVGRLPNVTVESATLEALAQTQAGLFDAAAVADVMYLLPLDAWVGFLKAIRTLLKPSGKLYLKEAEADGSWRELKCMAQERVMVQLLGRTHSSGALKILSRDKMRELISAAGFRVTCEQSLSRGYTTPHVLFVGECA